MRARTIKIKLDDGAYMPTRAHDTDAGLDLYAREDKVVPAGGSAVFDTGVHIQMHRLKLEFEDGYGGGTTITLPVGGFLKSKSGLNVKYNITSEGVIDMGYTGSIVVKLYNHGTEDYHVKRGDKISQLVIVPVLTPSLEVVQELDKTERGENGFGSTGR